MYFAQVTISHNKNLGIDHNNAVKNHRMKVTQLICNSDIFTAEVTACLRAMCYIIVYLTPQK